MVRDGYLYALGLIAAAVLVGWFAQPAWALVPLLLAVFFLWFFRDPERAIPDAAGAVVSPGDGKVTDCRIAGPEEATYTFGMDYADWRALHDGYDPQRTVMYRKILLEEGNVLEFFKSVYFFTECLGIIGAVPAGFPALAAR